MSQERLDQVTGQLIGIMTLQRAYRESHPRLDFTALESHVLKGLDNLPGSIGFKEGVGAGIVSQTVNALVQMHKLTQHELVCVLLTLISSGDIQVKDDLYEKAFEASVESFKELGIKVKEREAVQDGT